MKRSTLRNAVGLVAMFVLLLGLMPAGQAQTPEESLTQYVAKLHKNPDDSALREEIIQFVRTMHSVPAIPEEARRHYVAASALTASAKSIEDFSESIPAYKSALLFAPWWAEANRDLAGVLEEVGRFEEAITYLELYMATNPGYEGIRAALNEIMRIKTQGKWKSPC